MTTRSDKTIDVANFVAPSNTVTGPEAQATPASYFGKPFHSLSLLPALLTKDVVGLLLAFGSGWLIWQLPAPYHLTENGVHFLATLAAAVTLWIFNVFDEYVVALMLLLSWVLLQLVPIDVALSGFSKPSWFFVLGALGMGAAIHKAALLNRIAAHLLSKGNQRPQAIGYSLAGLGIAITPVLPRTVARIFVVAPLTQAVSDKLGVKSRSSTAAFLALSSYVGSTVATFMFISGGTYCLVGWSLLEESARAEFGWGTWTLAAFPAGLVTLAIVMGAIHILFPVDRDRGVEFSPTLAQSAARRIPLTTKETLCIAIVSLAVLAWFTKPLHGISEPWIPVAALILFLTTNVLDKNSFKNDIDWGLLLFFGISYSIGVTCSHLGVDRWLMDVMHPILTEVAFHPAAFLIFVHLLVYIVRLFLLHTPTTIILMLTLSSWADHMGIHPGALLLTILIAAESWFLPHQHLGYVLAYNYTKGEAFTHARARRVMAFKFVASFLALSISIPYWRFLGLIE